MSFELNYIADCVYIEAVAKDTMVKNADGILGSIGSSIMSYVKSLYDPKRPIASVLSFLGPGILFRLGFPWLGVLYEVADVLGFDWISFWDGVKENISSLLKSITSSGEKPSEAELSSGIDQAVKSSAAQNFHNDPDLSKLKDLATSGKLSTDISDARDLMHFASKYQSDKSIIKTAGIPGRFFSKVVKFFVRTISWLVKTALVSLGFAAAGGAISSIFKTDNSKPNSSPNEEDITPISLKTSPSIPSDLITSHRNDLSNTWIERASIEDIDSLLLSWILQTYPQLKGKQSELLNSSSFSSMRNKFLSRNRLATGLDIISIPKPYTRKIDIVSEIVRGFLSETHE